MAYYSYDYDFNRERVHDILERRVASWVKQVEIAQKAHVEGQAMFCLLYMLLLDLENYRKSPLSTPDKELIQKGEDLLEHTHP